MKSKLKFYFNKIIFYWDAYLKKLILLFIGLLICGFYLFWRLIKERLPYDIEFAWNIYLFSLYFYLILLYVYFLKQKLKPKASKNKIIIWLKEILFVKIIEIYDKSLLAVFKFFYFKVFGEYLLLKVCELLYKKSQIKIINTPNFLGVIFFLLDILPRIIAVECFFIDVIILNKFYYFYKFIWLLLIPFFFRICVFIMESYYNYVWWLTEVYYDIEIKKQLITKNNEPRVEMKIHVKRKTRIPPASIIGYQITEDDWIELNRAIPLYVCLQESFLVYIGSNGSFYSSNLYFWYQIITTATYILIWGYFALRLLLDNIINNLI